MGPFRHILVHLATPKRTVERTDDPLDWIEGEPGEEGPEVVDGVPFVCILFLPTATEETIQPRSRQVVRPTLLFEVARDDGTAIVVNADDELSISAPELAGSVGAPVARWQVSGDAQPFGPPGEVIGYQAELRQVRD